METSKESAGERTLWRGTFADPASIEAQSMRLISEELARRKITGRPEEMEVIRRVIHATADFDFAGNLYFTEHAVERGREALRSGTTLITDTNMALAGISRPSCERYKNRALCFMADPGIAARAKEQGCTRASVAMAYGAEHFPDAVFAVGNAPTALFQLADMILCGQASPSLVIAVPVGFVNVAESKEKILAVCEKHRIPAVIARGRKGGSAVCAAVVNALFYGMKEQGKDCK